jgi:hypothetical protein
LNDHAHYEFAEALARRLIREGKSTDARLQLAFEYCLCRPPTAAEQARLHQLLAACSSEPETESWTTVARVLLNLDETITRE